MLFHNLTKTFMTNPGYNNTRGVVTVTPAPGGDGHAWRVLGVHKLTDDENRGKRNIWFYLLDEQYNRLRDVNLIRSNYGRTPTKLRDTKPDHETPDIVLFAGELISLIVDAPRSECAVGFRSDLPDEGRGNTWGHHSYFVVFQRGNASSPPPPTPTPTPRPPIKGSVTIRLNVADLPAPDPQGVITLELTPK